MLLLLFWRFLSGCVFITLLIYMYNACIGVTLPGLITLQEELLQYRPKESDLIKPWPETYGKKGMTDTFMITAQQMRRTVGDI